jgi:heme/copper-type cytochrome/quinol oxidase subunit 2
MRRWAATGLIGLAIALAPAPTSSAAPTDRHIRVEASNFEYSPAEISVNPGDRVTLELVAADVVHGLHLDGYDLNLSADPGQPARLSFVADQAGTFRFHCSVTCGPLHPFMTGKLSVGPNWSLWRAAGLAILAVFAVAWLRRT